MQSYLLCHRPVMLIILNVNVHHELLLESYLVRIFGNAVFISLVQRGRADLWQWFFLYLRNIRPKTYFFGASI
jgi:hypothetical protein